MVQNFGNVSHGLSLPGRCTPAQRRMAILTDQEGAGCRTTGWFSGRLGVLVGRLFLLRPRRLTRAFDLFRPVVVALQTWQHPFFKFLLEVTLNAGHQVPVKVGDQGNCQTVLATTSGTANAV